MSLQLVTSPSRGEASGAERAMGPAIVRERLIGALEHADGPPVALLIAPAGYGKTTLLSQWARRDRRPFATVTLSAGDNDPRRLLARVARALSGIAPVDDAVSDAPATLGDGTVADVFEPFERAVAARGPFVLALDDVSVLEETRSFAAVAALADRLPAGSQLALASRREPRLPVGRWRAQGRLVELRVHELSMTRREAGELLRAAGLEPTPDEVLTLLQRTEGWPAGLSLAAAAVRAEKHRARAVRQFRGTDRFVSDYLHDELLSGLRTEELEFLARASILDVVSGPVCDAILGRSGSGALLRDLARANVLLVPLDHSETEYRHHALFAEMMRAELRRTEPGLERDLQRRAAAWYAARGDLDRAVDHSVAAGDRASTGRLLWANAAGHVLSGRTATVRKWLSHFTSDEVAANPGLALTAAATQLGPGKRDRVEDWADAAQRALGAETAGAERAALEAGVKVLRAAVARDGLGRMIEDAASGYALAADDSPWRSLCCLLSGVGLQLTGERARAKSYLVEGARRGGISAPLVQVLCLAQLALVAIEDNDWPGAEAVSSRARSQLDRVGLEDTSICALVLAVSARVRAQLGLIEQAQEDRRAALRLLGRLTGFVPWYLCEVRIALAGAALKLGDPVATRTLLADASRDAGDVAESVVLARWIGESSAAADTLAEGIRGPAALTSAELRVLQLLPTHLSFRQMAADLHVSANTVKTHAHAVYRKLNVCSRSDAVVGARAVGLLDDCRQSV